ncbi:MULTISPECIES: hypothetical protein [unclassified Streptomyces]|uniref:hypothetical protein n=1 Tax=unclassified Streptomyces TaxID=2593676 RepID=UPI0033A6C299
MTPENLQAVAGVGAATPEGTAANPQADAPNNQPSPENAAAAASASGMLLPEQKSPEAAQSPIGTAEALEGTVIPTDPAERLAFYEDQVFAARRDLVSDIQRYEDRLQAPLYAIKSDKLWQTKTATDGKPFRSWAQYIAERWPEISLATADRIIVHVPIERALGFRTSVRQDEVLWPIFRDHGSTAVLETWNKAMELGKPTPENLRIARDKLGHGKDEKLELAAPARAALASPVDRAKKQLDQLRKLSLGTIRSSAPEDAKQLAGELRALAEQLEGTAEASSVGTDSL